MKTHLGSGAGGHVGSAGEKQEFTETKTPVFSPSVFHLPGS